MSAAEYRVRIEYVATRAWLIGRWDATILGWSDFTPVAHKTMRLTRRGAERAVRRHIERMPENREYKYTITRNEVES